MCLLSSRGQEIGGGREGLNIRGEKKREEGQKDRARNCEKESEREGLNHRIERGGSRGSLIQSS